MCIWVCGCVYIGVGVDVYILCGCVWYGLVLYVNGCTKGNMREINQDILLGKRKGPIWHLKSFPWISTSVRSY